MSKFLIAIFLCLQLNATAQSKAKENIETYNKLVISLEDSIKASAGNLDRSAGFFIQQRRYSDSLKKYINIRLMEIDSQLKDAEMLIKLKQDLEKISGTKPKNKK